MTVWRNCSIRVLFCISTMDIQSVSSHLGNRTALSCIKYQIVTWIPDELSVYDWRNRMTDDDDSKPGKSIVGEISETNTS